LLSSILITHEKYNTCIYRLVEVELGSNDYYTRERDVIIISFIEERTVYHGPTFLTPYSSPLCSLTETRFFESAIFPIVIATF